MNLLEVNSICKTYGEGENAVHALKEVNFSVSKGEFVAAVSYTHLTLPTIRLV